MIGAFARMLRPKDHVEAVEGSPEAGWAVRSREGQQLPETRDAPPEGFVQRVSDEGGDVYLSPVVEAFRQMFRRKPSTDVTEASNPAPPTERP